MRVWDELKSWQKGAIFGVVFLFLTFGSGCISEVEKATIELQPSPSPSPSTPASEILISMKHVDVFCYPSPCLSKTTQYGLTPFDITLYENGTVVYSDYTGYRSAELTRDEVDEAVRVFEVNDFFSLNETYECPDDYSCSNDTGWFVYSFKKGVSLKTVGVYAGYTGPKELQSIQQALIEIYMKLPLILWGPIPPALSGTSGVFPIDKPIRSFALLGEGGNETALEYAEDSVTIKQGENWTFIDVDPKVETKENLISYREKSIKRIKYYIDTGHSGERLTAEITFARPLTEEEVVEIANISGFRISSLSFISTVGGGVAPYPLDHERLAMEEKEIGESQRAHNNVTDFVLIKGFVSARVLAEVTPKLLANNNIYLVDIGPVEFLEVYPEAHIGSGRSLFYSYNKFIASLDTDPPRINHVEVVPEVLTAADTFTIVVNVTDNVVVDKVNATIGSITIELRDLDGNGIFTGTGILPTIKDRKYTVNVASTDLAGNQAHDNSISITVK